MAISIHGKYCDQIYARTKTVEYRTWPTSHRGDILVCRTADKDTHMPGLCGIVADLYDCVDTGDGAYAFLLRNIRHIKPFAVKGQQRIFNIDVDPADLIVMQTKVEEDAAWREFILREAKLTDAKKAKFEERVTLNAGAIC